MSTDPAHKARFASIDFMDAAKSPDPHIRKLAEGLTKLSQSIEAIAQIQEADVIARHKLQK